MWNGSKGKNTIKWEGILEAEKLAGDGSLITGIGGSGVETDPIFISASGAYNLTVSEYQTTSGAYIAHAADITDPHGVTFTQTNAYFTGQASFVNIYQSGMASYASICLSGNASFASMVITMDRVTSHVAYVANLIFGTDATPPTASGFTTGSVYMQYTI